MPNVLYGNRMPHRQHVNGTVQDRIYKRSVFHLDAWIYQLKDDNLYLVLESRRAGVELIDATMYRMEPGTLYPVAWNGDVHRLGIRRHCDGPWARKHAPWLNTLHVTRIQPEARMPRQGYTAVSVHLHYVWTDAALDDPCEGVDNAYAMTGRAIRDAALRTPQTEAMNASITPQPRANPAWNAADRSRLRTLQKLLS